jgi:hypothetical protein
MVLTEFTLTAAEVEPEKVFQALETVNSNRLMNSPMTGSCNHSDLEKQMVLRAKRLIRVRKVRCLRSIRWVLVLPIVCS